ncbi:MAG: hypothetical protein ACRD3Q_16675, partial [Terriglobales bacterium]
GVGVAIFVDYIGSPMFRATSKALGREGVLTTAGWKLGLTIPVNRAMMCIGRNIHVHTHFARESDWYDASAFSVKHGWMPPVSDSYAWDNVDDLARDFETGTLSYFPLLEVNPI